MQIYESVCEQSTREYDKRPTLDHEVSAEYQTREVFIIEQMPPSTNNFAGLRQVQKFPRL